MRRTRRVYHVMTTVSRQERSMRGERITIELLHSPSSRGRWLRRSQNAPFLNVADGVVRTSASYFITLHALLRLCTKKCHTTRGGHRPNLEYIGRIFAQGLRPTVDLPVKTRPNQDLVWWYSGITRWIRAKSRGILYFVDGQGLRRTT